MHCRTHRCRSELVERRRSLVLCTIWRACFSKLLLRASASSRRASRNLRTRTGSSSPSLTEHLHILRTYAGAHRSAASLPVGADAL